MISEYTGKLVGSVAVVIGLTGCTGYSSAPSIENRNNLGIRNRFNDGLDNLAVVDELIKLKDEHGCLGVAKTPVKARESYLVLCSKVLPPVSSNDQLAVDNVENLIIAYRIKPTGRTN